MKIGLHGNILKWIKNYLVDRSFQVKINNSLSDPVTMDSGLPQGSCLSPILFALMTHDFPPLTSRSDAFVFADDWTISRSGLSIEIVSKHIQNDLDIVSNWCKDWGFIINVKKIKAVIFSKFLIKKNS